MSQVDDLLEVHDVDLRVAMRHFCKHCGQTYTAMSVFFFALAVYNEGLAIAIRKGAPLASYSIVRNCFKEFMTSLIHSDTKVFVCFARVSLCKSTVVKKE